MSDRGGKNVNVNNHASCEPLYVETYDARASLLPRLLRTTPAIVIVCVN